MHTPEFEVTKRYMENIFQTIRRRRILDIGGGPGRYSIFLAQKGHDVTLFDLSGKNIRQAIEKAQEADVLLDSCIHGDALRLSEYLYKAEQYDVVLLMGPLYHLMREQDREKALQEALRVLKAGWAFVRILYFDVCANSGLCQRTVRFRRYGQTPRRSGGRNCTTW